jgi:hypothetical protein
MSEPTVMSLGIAAQCWCDPRVSNREMDVVLAGVFAEKLDEVQRVSERMAEALEAALGIIVADWEHEGWDIGPDSGQAPPVELVVVANALKVLAEFRSATKGTET